MLCRCERIFLVTKPSFLFPAVLQQGYSKPWSLLCPPRPVYPVNYKITRTTKWRASIGPIIQQFNMAWLSFQGLIPDQPIRSGRGGGQRC